MWSCLFISCCLFLNAATVGHVVTSSSGTKMVLQNVNVENNQGSGVAVCNGAKLDATAGCHFQQNGGHGVSVSGSTTTVRLTNSTSHHNKQDGVQANSGAVVDLKWENKRPCTITKETACPPHATVAPSSSLPTLRSQRHVPRKQETKNIYWGYMCERVQQEIKK